MILLSEGKIKVQVNERGLVFSEGTTTGDVKNKIKPDADLLILNGYPVGEQNVLCERDRLVLIRRGEAPNKGELEFLIAARHSPGVYERLRKAKVGIAGLGGLGSSVAVALARMGVGSLFLVDYDFVEPSNLNRQQYTIDQIGLPKTEALRTSLEKINPFVQVKTSQEVLNKENVAGLFGSVDVLVECFDGAEEKKMLLETAAEKLPHTYTISASGLAGYGDSNSIKTWRLTGNIFIVGDLKKAAAPGQGLMAPRVGIAAHHQANLVVALLVDPKTAVSEIPDIPTGETFWKT